MERPQTSIQISPNEVFPEICRTCLCETTDRNLFAKDTNRTSLQMMLQTLIGLMINPGDKLPQYVCNRCAKAILAAYSFRNHIQRIDGILKCVLKQMSTMNDGPCKKDESVPLTKQKKTNDLIPYARKVDRKHSAVYGLVFDKRFRCKFCTKTFLIKKRKSHTKRKVYTCYTRGAMYIFQLGLLKHLGGHFKEQTVTESEVTTEFMSTNYSKIASNLTTSIEKNILQIGDVEALSAAEYKELIGSGPAVKLGTSFWEGINALRNTNEKSFLQSVQTRKPRNSKEQQYELDIRVKKEISDAFKIIDKPLSYNESDSETLFDNYVKRKNPDNDYVKSNSAEKRWKEAAIAMQVESQHGHQSWSIDSEALSNNKSDKSAQSTVTDVSKVAKGSINNDKPSMDQYKEKSTKRPSTRFICTIPKCKMKFKSRWEMASHYTSRHCVGPSPFECPLCSQEFPTKFQVRRHLKRTCVHRLNDKGLFKCYPRVAIKRYNHWREYKCNVGSKCVANNQEAQPFRSQITLEEPPIVFGNTTEKVSDNDHSTLKTTNEQLTDDEPLLHKAKEDSKEIPIRMDITTAKDPFSSDEQSLDQSTQDSSNNIRKESPLVKIYFTDKKIISGNSDPVTTTTDKYYEGTYVRYPCAICKEKFVYYSDIISHYTDQHNSRSTPYKCPVCAKVFRRHIQMFNHLKSHVTSVYKCPHCPHICQTGQKLKSHIHSHNNNYWVRCPVCWKNVKQYALLLHIRTHNFWKEYECIICSKVYYGFLSLLNHQKSHAEIKANHCYFCKKGFPNINRLRRHQKIEHLGQRLYRITVYIKRITSDSFPSDRIDDSFKQIPNKQKRNGKEINSDRDSNNGSEKKFTDTSEEINCFKDKHDEVSKVFDNSIVSGQTISTEPRPEFGAITMQKESLSEQVLNHRELDSRQKRLKELPVDFGIAAEKEKSSNSDSMYKIKNKLPLDKLAHNFSTKVAKGSSLERETDIHFSCAPEEESNRDYLKIENTNGPRSKHGFLERIWKEPLVRLENTTQKEISEDHDSKFEIKNEPLSDDESSLDQLTEEFPKNIVKVPAPVEIDLTAEEEIQDNKDANIRPYIRYTCMNAECKKEFGTHQGIMNHYIGLQNMVLQPFKCSICEKVIHKNDEVLKHMESHVVAKYKCLICLKLHETTRNFRAHLYSHREKTRKADTSKQHMSPHCSKVHKAKTKLESYTRTHTHAEERTFQCPRCPKKCSTQNHLHAHMAIHKNFDYECKFCWEAFYSRNDLFHHVRSVHVRRSYSTIQ